MKHKIIIELEYDSTNFGFEDWLADGLDELGAIKSFVCDDGFCDLIGDLSNEEMASMIKSVTKMED